MNTCLNCDNTYEGSFCSICGQKSSVKRLEWRTVMKELPKSLLNIEKGILFTLKQMTVSPRGILLGYLDGKRVRLFPPIQYAILGVTLYTVLQLLFEPTPLGLSPINDNVYYDYGVEYGRVFRHNLKYFWLFNILLFALPCRLLFPQYNLPEHLVMNAYIIGHTAFLALFSLFFFRLPILFNPFIYILIGLYYFLLFKEKKNQLGTLALVIAVLGMSMFLFLLLPLPILFFQQWFGI